MKRKKVYEQEQIERFFNLLKIFTSLVFAIAIIIQILTWGQGNIVILWRMWRILANNCSSLLDNPTRYRQMSCGVDPIN